MLWEYANGLDDAPVAESGYKRIPKSVGNSTTTAEDMTSDRQIERTFHMLSESVAERLRRHGLKGTVVQITVRDSDLEIYEKQKIIYRPTDDAKVIYAAARELFRESYDWNKGVRSIGVRCTKLVRQDSGEQLSLFSEVKREERDDRLNKAIDDINRRYGSSIIKSAAEAESFTRDNKAANIVNDPFHPEDNI
jgi:DNA polymerase-4